jgi:hypothetical protein
MGNDVTWAYRFAGFEAAKIVEINEQTKTVYIKLTRREKKLFAACVILAVIIFMIAK